MKKKGNVFKQVSTGLMILSFLFGLAVLPVHAEVVFEEDFESGWDSWSADNGVWEIGTPTAGPEECHGGTQCAGTVLDGNYPTYTDSRLITPSFRLPEVSGDEEIHLRFWQWFSYRSGTFADYGYVQINEYDDATGEWLGWTTIGNRIQDASAGWSLMGVGLTGYAGKKIKIAFYHTSDRAYTSTGWYIDDIQITKKVPEFTSDFEDGWVDWYADRGVWQVGTPTAGPDKCHGGTQCAGTVLDGNYPEYTYSRLISVPIRLCDVSGDEEIHLRFWQWFSYRSGTFADYGYVQINVYDDDTGSWLGWTTIGNRIQDASAGWSLRDDDLTSHTGKMIKLGFYHTSDRAYTSTGWYIDDIEITGCDCTDGDLNCDGKVDRDDYAIFRTAVRACDGDVNFIPEADLDGDGCVTINDLRILRTLVTR